MQMPAGSTTTTSVGRSGAHCIHGLLTRWVACVDDCGVSERAPVVAAFAAVGDMASHGYYGCTRGERHTPWAGVQRAICACVLALSLMQCVLVRPPEGIQLPPPVVDPKASLDTFEPILIDELRGAHHANQVSPEQIGALAAHELSAGNTWDAAVLLALASYRRTEQVHHLFDNKALVSGTNPWNGRPYDVDYTPLKNTAMNVLAAARFDGELERIAVSVGAPLDQEALKEDLGRIVLGNLSDLDSQWHRFNERLTSFKEPEPERIAHPRLAHAVLVYLSACADHLQGSYFRAGATAAARYLALVPLFGYRSAALQKTPNSFNGVVLRSGVLLYRQKPALIRAALEASRAQTRSHAAVILGLVEDLSQLPQLEAALAKETDEDTRLSMHYALFRLGETSHLQDLHNALRKTDLERLEHAVYLIEALPVELLLEVPEELVRDVLERTKSTVSSRVVAAMALRQMSTKRPLTTRSLVAMLEAADKLRDSPTAFERLCNEIASLDQLDRATVLGMLSAPRDPLEPWLERLARIVQPQDLPLLQQMMNSREPGAEWQRVRVLRAAAAIPGPEAQALLQTWYVDYPKLRRPISLSLAMRAHLDRLRLEEMLHSLEPDANGLFYELASGQSDVNERLARYVASEDVDERFTATLAVKLFGRPEHALALWQNVAFYNTRYYPFDALLRQLTLSALLDVELNQRRTPSAASRPAQNASADPLRSLPIERSKDANSTSLAPATEPLPNASAGTAE
jgi:hypothetical protein